MTAPVLLSSGSEQSTPHERCRLLEAGDEYVLQLDLRGVSADVYRFDLVRQLPPDIDQGNWYMSTHPDSPFTTGLTAARLVADGRYGLRNNQLAIHNLNGATERGVLQTVNELRDALTGMFGLTPPDDPALDAALTRMTIGAIL